MLAIKAKQEPHMTAKEANTEPVHSSLNAQMGLYSIRVMRRKPLLQPQYKSQCLKYA